MQRGLWSLTRKDSLWHEMSGDVKVRGLLRPFFRPLALVAGLVSGLFFSGTGYALVNP
jgi:hypothetical protein